MNLGSDSYAQSYTRPSIQVEECDDTTYLNSEAGQDAARSRTPFYASSSSSSTELNSQRANRPSSRSLLYPAAANQSTPSLCSTASTTPIPSRAASPLYTQDDDASSCSSDGEENELESSLLGDGHRRSYSLQEAPRWWRDRSLRRRRRGPWWYREMKRIFCPFVPKTPLTILITLLLFTAFGISLTYLIIYLCNPDKQPLPWRGYCTIPEYSTEPPPTYLDPYASFPIEPPKNFTPRVFPPDNLETLSPAGVFLGVFSMDTGFERRSLIRSTYASHPRSRNGAGEGDGGVGTSRTVVRFIMGKPRKDFERRVQLEMETYNDIVILPIKENMNDGKTYAYFHWAASNAWVPPLYFDHFESVPKNLSYTNQTTPAPVLAQHDPVFAHRDIATGNPQNWVRPDFIIKADDDSFVMLAELEAHLRIQLHGGPLPARYGHQPELIAPPASPNQSTAWTPPNNDPLIFWGYLVKNRFMGGELYALSHALVEWLANDPGVRENVRGAEDQVTAKWVRVHPRWQDVRWVRERCWIYDHPKAGTVYSRGFLFPSEARRIQQALTADMERWNRALKSQLATRAPIDLEDYAPAFGPQGQTPPNWVLSSVATFQVRYAPPVPGLSLPHSIEALVEGADMSKLKKRNTTAAEEAWRNREGRVKRYEGKRVGGTAIVHSIKKHMWFLETASAFLEGDDYTELERAASLHQTHLAMERQEEYSSRMKRMNRNIILSRDRTPL